MWCSKGTACHERLPWPQQPDDAMNLGRFQRFFQSKWWKDRRQAFCQHGFARAWRPYQQCVMTTGGGDLQCALYVFLSFHFREIHFLVVIVIEEFRDINF